MRSIFILSFIAVLCACNQQAPAKETETETGGNNTPAATSKDVPVDMIENPSTASNPKAVPGALPILSFKNTYHDFGDILEPQDVETTFEFTNTGNADLLISDCTAACGCTVPNCPREPIKPGKGGTIKVQFKSAGKSGVNNKIVTVKSNTKEGTTELKFRANVQAKKEAE